MTNATLINHNRKASTKAHDVNTNAHTTHHVNTIMNTNQKSSIMTDQQTNPIRNATHTASNAITSSSGTRI
eukprot:2962307-Pyramimonas_sp.AAC.1